MDAAAAAAVKIVCPPNVNDRGMTSAVARQAMQKVIALCDKQPLVLRAGSQLALGRIEGVNVAFNKPVTISCETEEGHPKELATDGIVNVDSAWWGKPWPCSLTVDLQEAVSIDSFRPIFHWDNGRRFYAYSIEVSTDNANWQKVVDATENTLTSTNRGIFHPLRQPVTARYARLNIVKNSANYAAHVVEFEVYSKSAKPPLATGPNLLLKQPVTFGSDQEQDHSPERAVDGLIGKWDGWHTDKCPTWLQVDIQRVAETVPVPSAHLSLHISPYTCIESVVLWLHVRQIECLFVDFARTHTVLRCTDVPPVEAVAYMVVKCYVVHVRDVTVFLKRVAVPRSAVPVVTTPV